MIIVRTPFRVSFCGGGSDLPTFYERHGGCVLSTTIRKYMYLSIHNYFYKDRILLKYSNAEEVTNHNDIDHKYFKESLKEFGVSGVEITVSSDIPAGTGLGSSSTFIVALLHLLHVYKGEFVSKYKIAKDACDFEINKMHETVGKQDQFAAAFGGLKFYEFQPNGFVDVEPILMSKESYKKLESNILMFYIGGKHSAAEILRKQSANINEKNKAKAQIKMCGYARQLKEELQKNNVDAMGELLHKNWILKKSLSSDISNPIIDEVYETAMSAGAQGGKLLGAGGAGFMIFYVRKENQEDVRNALKGYREVEYEMDNSGTSIVFVDKDFG